MGNINQVQVAGITYTIGHDVDSSLSSTSTNPIQNKAVKSALDTLESSLSTVATSGSYEDLSDKPEGVIVDSAMSSTSTNPVQNKVIKSAIDDAKVVVDTELSDTSTNPVQNKVISTALTDGSVTKVGTATKGGDRTPIYLNAGVPTACTGTLPTFSLDDTTLIITTT